MGTAATMAMTDGATVFRCLEHGRAPPQLSGTGIRGRDAGSPAGREEALRRPLLYRGFRNGILCLRQRFPASRNGPLPIFLDVT